MSQADLRSITFKLPRALPPTTREKVETAIESHLAAVEALTAFLDVADDFNEDEDEHDGAEPDQDGEPSLGSIAHSENEDQSKWAEGDAGITFGGVDLEEGHDGAEYTWPETYGRGGSGGPGGHDDAEPSLAHTNDVDQSRAKRNVTGTRFTADKQAWFTMDRDLEAEHDGREPQCEDEGAQCDDEGAEVMCGRP